MSTNTIISTFINQYLQVHMCPRYILSDNDIEFKNQLMDQVLQPLAINNIFSATYHPKSNGKFEIFHKYLKPTLKKLCEKDPTNWDKYTNQVLTSYRVMPNLATVETHFLWSMKETQTYPYINFLNQCNIFMRPRIWKTKPRKSSPHTSHCKEVTG